VIKTEAIKSKLLAILLIFLIVSCNTFYNITNQDMYNYKFSKYEPYLSIDSVYKTPAEKLKFIELKDHFLKVWLKPYDYKRNEIFCTTLVSRKDGYKDEIYANNCYYSGSANGFGDFCIRKVYVDNILHTQNYDTLIVLVVTDEADLDSNGQLQVYNIEGKKHTYERIRGYPIRVLVDSVGEWKFICKPMLYGVDGSGYSEEGLGIVRQSLKRTIIRCNYFKKDLTPDSTFWHRMFTDPDIFWPNPQKDGFPLH
jgi:hypothetical protein